MTPDRIRAMRRLLGLSQTEAAERCGVTLWAWKSWESEKGNRRQPSGSARVLLGHMQTHALKVASEMIEEAAATPETAPETVPEEGYK